jgi:thioredoxin-like negative regulator of GroEL
MKRLIACLALVATSALGADDLYIFTREGCAPCERLKAAIASDPSITDGCVVYSVNVQRHPLIAAMRRVSAVPAVILERDGREIGRRVGFDTSLQLRNWIQEKRQK